LRGLETPACLRRLFFRSLGMRGLSKQASPRWGWRSFGGCAFPAFKRWANYHCAYGASGAARQLGEKSRFVGDMAKGMPDKKQERSVEKPRGPMVDLCGLPPIEQKDARWMGHSFIHRGPAKPVEDSAPEGRVDRAWLAPEMNLRPTARLGFFADFKDVPLRQRTRGRCFSTCFWVILRRLVWRDWLGGIR
jgi:hypothetical protein